MEAPKVRKVIHHNSLPFVPHRINTVVCNQALRDKHASFYLETHLVMNARWTCSVNLLDSPFAQLRTRHDCRSIVLNGPLCWSGLASMEVKSVISLLRIDPMAIDSNAFFFMP